MYMKKFFLLKLTVFLAAFSVGALPPVYAQNKAEIVTKAMGKGKTPNTIRVRQNNLSATLRSASQISGATRSTEQALRQQRQNTQRRIEEISRRTREVISPRGRFHGPAARLPFDPVERIEIIAKNNPNPIRALYIVWDLEDSFPGRHFFSLYASNYYKKNFAIFTPHLRDLFKHVEKLHNRDLELRLMKRMVFLAENKENFRAAFAPNSPTQGLRMRYIKNIGKLTPSTFNPSWLAFSFERKLNPHQREAFIRHINAQSRFPVGKTGLFPIFRYNGPFEYLPNLYRYLLNGDHPKNKLTVLFDRESRAMSIYNEDKSVWLRITEHEYSYPERLHIHLNEMQTSVITTKDGKQVEETVHFNLSIPLTAPANLPARHRQEFLYNEMVLKPLQYFKGNDHIKVKEAPIF